MKPIERGMTTAVTRDGREVTQLTWFEGVECTYRVMGVVDGVIESWTVDGLNSIGEVSDFDIFAPTQYEWQWLYVDKNGWHHTTSFFKSEQDMSAHYCGYAGIRIEESKREVQK